ncbi:MAG: DUF1801 domain-containing protein [Pseudooceanicola sp.]
MAQNKTQATNADVTAFLDQVEPARRRAQGQVLLPFFEKVSGYPARMWGPSIIGFGRYDYRYESGREGSFLATGFSPRKASISIYIMPGYADFSGILDRLGPHKIGKSCLYVTKLDAIDMDVLAELIRAGLADLDARWPVSAE